MALADELAYATATELAGRIRRRELSPVEVVDAFIDRIEDRNQHLNAFVYLGFDEARQRAREAEQALGSGVELGVLHGVPTAIKDLFDFTPGWPATFGASGPSRSTSWTSPAPSPSGSSGPARSWMARPTARSWGSGGPATTTCSGPAATPSTPPRTPAAPREAVPARSPTGCSRWLRDRWGRLDPDPGFLVLRVRLQGLLRPHPLPQPAQRLLRRQPVPVRG